VTRRAKIDALETMKNSLSKSKPIAPFVGSPLRIKPGQRTNVATKLSCEEGSLIFISSQTELITKKYWLKFLPDKESVLQCIVINSVWLLKRPTFPTLTSDFSDLILY
jgi:hypothetical protein